MTSLRHLIVALRICLGLPTIKNLQDKSFCVYSSWFELSDNFIQSLYMYMSLSANNINISLLFNDAQNFLPCITVVQFKSTGIINGFFHFSDPGLFLQTVNIRTFTITD